MKFGTGEHVKFNQLDPFEQTLYLDGRTYVLADARNSITHRYKLGELLKPTCQPESEYSGSALSKLAQAWSVGFAYLKKSVLVASRITETELTKLIREADRRNFALCFGHLIEIAQVDSGMRSRVVRALFIERLRVLDLKRLRFNFTTAGASDSTDTTVQNEITERHELGKLEALWSRVRHRPNFRPLAQALDEIRENILG